MSQRRSCVRLLLRVVRFVAPRRWGESVEGDLEEEWASGDVGRERTGRPRVGEVLAIVARFAWLRLADALDGRRGINRSSRRTKFGGSAGGTMLRHLRYGIRALVRQPAVSAVATLSLTLSIGAGTVGFSLVDGLILRPVRGTTDPEQLVALFSGNAQRPYGSVSFPDYRDYRASSDALADLAVFLSTDVEQDDQAGPERVHVEVVTANYFAVVGAPAVVGRAFVETEDRVGEAGVTVISHRFWKQRFGSDPTVIGRRIRMRGRPFVVIGVAPERFRGVTLASRPDLWVTTAHVGLLVPDFGAGVLERRHWSVWRGVGRLRPGQSADRATAQLRVLAAELERRDPGRFPRVVTLLPLQDAAFPPGSRDVVRTYATGLVMVVGVVLLAACVNVANLLLARGWARRRELAIRRALGADRRELFGQLLVESSIIAAAGGVAGVVLAVWLMPTVSQIQLPALVAVDVSLDKRLLTFALGLSSAVGLAFGVSPALRLSRADFLPAISPAPVAEGRHPVLTARRLFLMAQVALSVVLLVGAGLLVRTLLALQAVNPGFDPQALVAARLDPERSGYSTESATSLLTELQSHLTAQPAVAAVSLSSYLPLEPDDTSRINAFVNDGAMNVVGFNLVARDYFATMRIPILQGRTFTADELARGSVIVISDAMARELWPGQSPIGQFITTRQGGQRWEVIGVAADVKSKSLRGSDEPYMYIPFPRVPKMFNSSIHLVVRTTGDVAGSGLIRQALQTLNAKVPVLEETTLPARVAASTARERQSAAALAGFALLALGLALGGVFGLASYGVERRTPELGVRMALGASPVRILALVVGQHVMLVAIGLAVGLPAAAAAAQLLAGQLYGVSALDPWTMGGVSIAIAVSGISATVIPAHRATRIDPVAALRRE